MISGKAYNQNPVAIGGVGGSGTRVVAQILQTLGFHLGTDLNRAKDNLWFTFFFKHLDILKISDRLFLERYITFVSATFGLKLTMTHIELINYLASSSLLFNENWYRERSKSILSNKDFVKPIQDWGWKEPNTHIILERLINLVPGIKYIHVMRNGLDMAFSSNQNQLRLWGEAVIGNSKVNPKNSLRFWCEVHQRVFNFSKQLGDNFFLINYDDLCINQNVELRRLFGFLKIFPSKDQITSITGIIHKPESIGRYKKNNLTCFNRQDLKYVISLGFDISDTLFI